MKKLIAILITSILTITVNALTINVMSFNNVSCNGKNDGSVSVLMTGGTGMGTYSWSTGSTAKTISNLAPNSYTVTVNDADGIPSTSVFVITEPNVLVANGGTNKTICIGSSVNLSGSATGGTGIYGYAWSGGSAIVNPVTNTTYTLTVTDANSCKSTSTVSVIVNQLPIVSFTGLGTLYCKNASPVTLIGSPSGGVFSGKGIVGNTFNTLDTSGVKSITYTFTDGNGCTASQTKNVTVLANPKAPSICMITVDTISKYNIIMWDKTSILNADSFIIYREITSNDYQRIGAVSKSVLSQFVDTVRTKYHPNTGNPNTGTYRYKIAIRDTCGNYSEKSNYHNTLYTNQSNGTFTWNAYEMEGKSIPVQELTSYVLYRDDNSTGSWNPINSVSGTQYVMTDPNYLSYPNASWRVETQWSIGCTPTAKVTNGFFASRSNINKPSSTTGIENIKETGSINVYPNPFDKQTKLSINIKSKSMVTIILFNSLGQEISVIENKTLEGGDYTYDLNVEDKGIYMLKSVINGHAITQRIIELN